ncbi:hypothetical protein AC622_08900 [Bacillus sp. FJAT-27916]|uniref:TetR/AcrR family transcriptional regulator n=1 Tax=Bacillus sp. FJAT-27916 TaxID=1679169 RepID=UPI0006717727|nr:TetR/AcrR family transcriptional regulator [Bacillus sp. FJAT-27916]KMY44351.1 hypothetical protein AC622_08900 [Bacillus sp. FJAT-27916]
MDNHYMYQEIETQSAKEKLITGFRDLVLKKNFEKLTVAEICEQANVSRKTFYTYFKDKNDIMEQIIWHSLSQPFAELRKLYSLHDLAPTVIMEWLYQRIYEDREFYTKISRFSGQNSFEEFLLKHTTSMLGNALRDVDLEEVDKEYTVYFYAASHTTLLIKWIRDGMVVSPEKMASFYEKWTIPTWREICKHTLR